MPLNPETKNPPKFLLELIIINQRTSPTERHRPRPLRTPTHASTASASVLSAGPLEKKPRIVDSIFWVQVVSPVVFLVILWSGEDVGGCIVIEGFGDGSAYTIGMNMDADKILMVV